MMYYVIIANIIALVGSIFMVVAGLSKNNKSSLLFQSIQIFLFILSNIILCGYTGVVINSLSLVRNIIAYKGKLNGKYTTIILITIIIFTIIFNNLGLIGYLPLVGTVVFTIFINSKSVFKFKLSLCFGTFMWLIYDICINSYSSAVFDFFTIVALLISLVKVKKLI